MGLLTRLLSCFPFGNARKWQEAAPEWRVLVDDKQVAVLCAPFFADLAWVSLEIVPLELQRRIVNDLVKHREYWSIVMLAALLFNAGLGVQPDRLRRLLDDDA